MTGLVDDSMSAIPLQLPYSLGVLQVTVSGEHACFVSFLCVPSSWEDVVFNFFTLDCHIMGQPCRYVVLRQEGKACHLLCLQIIVLLVAVQDFLCSLSCASYWPSFSLPTRLLPGREMGKADLALSCVQCTV